MKCRQYLENFILPERSVSLKLLFDNLRNFMLCGLFFTAIRTVDYDLKKLNPPLELMSLYISNVMIFSMYFLFALALSGNFIQSWLLLKKIFRNSQSDDKDRMDSLSSQNKKRLVLNVVFEGFIYILSILFFITILGFIVVAVQLVISQIKHIPLK